MLKGLYTAYTGMLNEQHRMDTITNNLANSNTTGYKKEGATAQSFHDTLAYKIKDLSETPRLARRVGAMSMGVKIGENYTDYSEGPISETGNTFDIALNGNGFFTIEFQNKAGETSTKYTRDGKFQLDTSGYLVTEDGDYVLNNRGAHIKLDPLKTTFIDQKGNIYQSDANDGTDLGSQVTQIKLTDFEDYNYLEHYGENMFQTVEGAKEKAADAKVLSGYLEHSNVQVVYEMVDMVNLSRAYETNQKMIQTYDSSLEIAVSQLGKLS